jgi:hypothetical protein
VIKGAPFSQLRFFHPSIVMHMCAQFAAASTTRSTAELYASSSSLVATCLRSGGVAPRTANAAFSSGLLSRTRGVSVVKKNLANLVSNCRCCVGETAWVMVVWTPPRPASRCPITMQRRHLLNNPNLYSYRKFQMVR